MMLKWISFFFLAVSATLNPFQLPLTPELSSLVSATCNAHYGASTLLGKHIRGVFGNLGVTLPPLPDYSTQLLGLQQAIKLFPSTFQTQEEFSAFLANVLWESICLSQVSELCTGGSGCPEKVYYGRGYIQLTGEANYQAFADYINRQDIMSNPDLVALDQALAWGSALFFWETTKGCKGSTNVGQALLCVNANECLSSQQHSSAYFQFAPYYRLTMTQSIASSIGASDMTSDAQNVCQQMSFQLNQVWSDFCAYHGNAASVNCPFDPAGGPISSSTAGGTGSPTSTVAGSAPGATVGSSPDSGTLSVSSLPSAPPHSGGSLPSVLQAWVSFQVSPLFSPAAGMAWAGASTSLAWRVFWQRKCEQLTVQNKELKAQIEQEKESRRVCEKVQAKSRVKLGEWQMTLEQYQVELGAWAQELQEREDALCVCQQTAVPIPTMPKTLPLCEDFDPISDEDEQIDFVSRATDDLSQLLVSHASAASINLALNDLCVKTDTSDLDCLTVVIYCILGHLKAHELLLSPERTLRHLLKVFDCFMPPEERLKSELQLLSNIQTFILGHPTKRESYPILIKTFYDLDILHIPSLLNWANLPDQMELEKASLQVLLKPLLSELTARLDSKSKEQDWALQYTICDAGCQCHSLVDGETSVCRSLSNSSSQMSDSTLAGSIVSASEEESFQEEPVQEHHSSKLYFSNIKLVREFYSDSEVHPEVCSREKPPLLDGEETESDDDMETYAINYDHLESIGVF
ncbi:hypothetical protein HDU91_006110 [Kappamyces sp. JEL0680]|nr:hypothetical protein HDU91_006110 [Kappamyces sp. JEL0680]